MEESELFEGLKVNVLDDGLQVVEPDVLVDISAIAACFQDYGHHPLAYLINRLKPSANTSPILLGNFAGTALDQIIHDPEASLIAIGYLIRMKLATDLYTLKPGRLPSSFL